MINWQALRDDPAERGRVSRKWAAFQVGRTLFEPSMLYRGIFESSSRAKLSVLNIAKPAGKPSRYRVGNTDLDIVAVEIEQNDIVDKPDQMPGSFHVWRMLKKHGIDPELGLEWPIFRFDRPDTGGIVFMQIRERLSNGKEIKYPNTEAGDR